MCDYLARWLLNDHLLDLGIKMGNHPQAHAHTYAHIYVTNQPVDVHIVRNTILNTHTHTRTQIVVLTFSCMYVGLFLFLCLLNRYFYAINKVGSHNTCVSLCIFMAYA